MPKCFQSLSAEDNYPKPKSAVDICPRPKSRADIYPKPKSPVDNYHCNQRPSCIRIPSEANGRYEPS